ncbi:MAG: hypothetical protein ACLFTH_04420 [Candidatus Woesearchaeota archaeon]
MFRKKVYGQNGNAECLFCSKTATTKNEQGVPVCKEHTESILNDFKCACGEYLDIKESKYGIFFTCMNCGAVSLKKALLFNEIKDESKIPSVHDL